MEPAGMKEWIQHMMGVRGWSQSELAKRTGVHQTQISRWTRGIAIPDRAHRAVLAAAFGVPEADVHLLAGDPVAARGTAQSPHRERAHQLVDVMDPALLADLVPLLERLVTLGGRS